MNRGIVVRCFLAGSIAVLLLVRTNVAFAANPSDLAVHADPIWPDNAYGMTDYVADWRTYCSPGATNIVRWYTGDGTLQSVTPNPFDCALGMPTNASYPAGVPGAISLWNFGSSIIPASLPHSVGNTGADGDFYFTVTSNVPNYTKPSATTCTQNCVTNVSDAMTITKDSIWNDGGYGNTDLVGNWQPYCTPGTTNTVRWYTADNVMRSVRNNFDCAAGMPNNASYPTGIPGTVSLWNFGSNIVPASLPHSVGNFGADGDFYITMTNGNGETFRHDFGWHTVPTITRFDWSWKQGKYSFPSDATTTIPLQTATVTAPVIIVPGIMGSAKHNDEWVIDPITHGFDNLIDTLLANGYTRDIDLFTFPYDWHKSNVETAVLLKQKIDSVKTVCKCEKVDLVAHSMGGLVSRQYIQSDAYANDVRNMIFIGTPHLGAPLAYLMWEGAETEKNRQGQLLKFYLRLEALENKYFNLFQYLRNVGGAGLQQLLPIYGYVKQAGQTEVMPYPNDLWYPSNAFLSDLDENINNLYDSGVTINNFVGKQFLDSTITVIRVAPPSAPTPGAAWEHGQPDGFYDGKSLDNGLERGAGDDTVPQLSSSYMNRNLHVLDANHGELITQAAGAIFRILTGKPAATLFSTQYGPDTPAAIFSLLSPADMLIVAPDGKRVGKDFATNKEVNEISGAFYSGFSSDLEYVTILNPLNGQYRVVTEGKDGGGDYRVVAGIVHNATSSETIFYGRTLPGLVIDHSAIIDTSQPDGISIVPTDQISPTIYFAEPATSSYTRADILPIKVFFSDDTGIASSSVRFDTKTVSASSTIDLFYETLGKHVLAATSTDLVNNMTTATKTIHITATASSTISDIQRAYALGWIKSINLRDLLFKKVTAALKLQKNTDTMIVSTNPKIATRVDRWAQSLDTAILKSILMDLAVARSLRLINEQGYRTLTSDITWIIAQ